MKKKINTNKLIIKRSALYGWIIMAMFLWGVDSSAFVDREYEKGEVIVKYRESNTLSLTSIHNMYERLGVLFVDRISNSEDTNMNGVMEHITFNHEEFGVEELIEILEKNPAVEYAQPNYIWSVSPIEVEESKPYAACPVPGIPFPPGCEDGEQPPPGKKPPCLIPGLPFPPGCEDGGGGGPGQPPKRPDIEPLPGEPEADADPNMGNVYGMARIQAPEAWKINKGSKDVIVAVIDTGVDYNHPDLAFNMWRNPKASSFMQTGVNSDGSDIVGDVVGWDFINNDNLPFDDHMHGSHCAGIIGAVGENGIGVSGVAQRVSIMALKFITKGNRGSTAGAIKSINYAVSRGAKILSNSWGTGGSKDMALEASIKNARDKGVLFIAAAGNAGGNNDQKSSWPANHGLDLDNVISVAATDSRDKLARFSDYGKKAVHLSAPGVAVYSTIPGKTYKRLSGTSMATPHVAGAAALLWSHYPDASYLEIKERLLKFTDSIPSLKDKTITGGRLNILKSLEGEL